MPALARTYSRHNIIDVRMCAPAQYSQREVHLNDNENMYAAFLLSFQYHFSFHNNKLLN